MDSAAAKSAGSAMLSSSSSTSLPPLEPVESTTGSVPTPQPSKRAKLFSFMKSSDPRTAATPVQLTAEDVKHQLLLFLSDEEVSGKGLAVLNERKYIGLKPLARQLFCAPASSAASERLFSRAGLIVRPNRAKLSKMNVSKLAFLSSNSSRL